MLEHAGEALLGDLQRVQEVGDGHAGLAVDEMDDPVMRPPKAALFEDRIRVGGEVAIGKEEQLDDLEIDRVIIGGGIGEIPGVLFGLAGHAVISFQPDCNLRNIRKNTSALLTYFYRIVSVLAR
ncbi:hypothetical protein D9M72_536250 [compost metagenome]